MKIFVAGASGVIGRALMPLLVAAGYDTVGLAKDEAAAETIRSMGARAVVVDVFARDALIEAVGAARPDAVIHQLTSLGSSDVAANNRIRTEGTRNLVDAALAAGARRMVAQSYAVYAPGPGLAHESDAFDVASPALGSSAEALLVLEETVNELPEAVLLRNGTMYGTGTSWARGGATAEQARKGELAQTGDVVSFVHVRDVAQAAMLALGWPTGPVNIVDDEPAPATEWLPVYAACVGAPTPTKDPSRALGLYVGLRGVSNERARKECDWAPTVLSWRDGFREALG
jgi:nucleoside-diphosphate-sugar epimerase